MTRTLRQLHVRLSQRDYDFLLDLADAREETMATVVRRLIRTLRATINRSDTTPQKNASEELGVNSSRHPAA